MKKLEKDFIVSILILIVLILIGGTAYFYSKNKSSDSVTPAQMVAQVLPCGASSSVIEIRTADDLLAIQNNLAPSPDVPNRQVIVGNFRQCANIVLPAGFPYGLGTIPGSYNSFAGTYDGNGYTISNFHGRATSALPQSDLPGLFSVVDRGTIRNMKIVMAENPASSAAGYGLLTRVAKFASIDGLEVSGKVPFSGTAQGLIANQIWDSTVHNLTLKTTTETSTGDRDAAGFAWICKRSTIDGAYINLSIKPRTGQSPLAGNAAGLFGIVSEPTSSDQVKCRVLNVRGTVAIRSQTLAAGLVGTVHRPGLDMSNVLLVRSQVQANDGEQATNLTMAGGMIGSVYGPLTVDRAIFQGSVRGVNAAGIVATGYAHGDPMVIRESGVLNSHIRGQVTGGIGAEIKTPLTGSDLFVRDTTISPMSDHPVSGGGIFAENEDGYTILSRTYFSGTFDAADWDYHDPTLALNVSIPAVLPGTSNYFNSDLFHSTRIWPNQTARTTTQLTSSRSAYTGFNFNTTWRTPANGCYPELRNAPRFLAADMNGNGSVTSQDLLDYTGQYIAGELTADFNGDGTVNQTDLFAFLNSYNNPSSCNTSGIAPQCSDGIDNDRDGLRDLADTGCSSATDNDETNSAPITTTPNATTKTTPTTTTVLENTTTTPPPITEQRP